MNKNIIYTNSSSAYDIFNLKFEDPFTDDVDESVLDDILLLHENDKVIRPNLSFNPLFVLPMDMVISKSPIILPGNTGFLEDGMAMAVASPDGISLQPFSTRLPESTLEVTDEPVDDSLTTVAELFGVSATGTTTKATGLMGYRPSPIARGPTYGSFSAFSRSGFF